MMTSALMLSSSDAVCHLIAAAVTDQVYAEALLPTAAISLSFLSPPQFQPVSILRCFPLFVASSLCVSCWLLHLSGGAGARPFVHMHGCMTCLGSCLPLSIHVSPYTCLYSCLAWLISRCIHVRVYVNTSVGRPGLVGCHRRVVAQAHACCFHSHTPPALPYATCRYVSCHLCQSVAFNMHVRAF